MRLSDLESLYHNFRNTYQAHIQKAGFDNILQRDLSFVSLKLRLISIRFLLEGHRPLDPEMRSDLIRSVLFDGDFYYAQQTLNFEDTLKGDMENLAASVSDSQFLLDIKNIGEEEIRPIIEQVGDVVYKQLGSSIGQTVEKMTRDVLNIQQEQCRRSTHHEVENEKRSLLRGELIEFIRSINALSVERSEP